MTKITVLIEDDDQGNLSIVGSLDDPTAVNGPPTPALIFCSYLGAHADPIAKSAWKWFLERDETKQ